MHGANCPGVKLWDGSSPLLKLRCLSTPVFLLCSYFCRHTKPLFSLAPSIPISRPVHPRALRPFGGGPAPSVLGRKPPPTTTSLLVQSTFIENPKTPFSCLAMSSNSKCFTIRFFYCRRILKHSIYFTVLFAETVPSQSVTPCFVWRWYSFRRQKLIPKPRVYPVPKPSKHLQKKFWAKLCWRSSLSLCMPVKLSFRLSNVHPGSFSITLSIYSFKIYTRRLWWLVIFFLSVN